MDYVMLKKRLLVKFKGEDDEMQNKESTKLTPIIKEEQKKQKKQYNQRINEKKNPMKIQNTELMEKRKKNNIYTSEEIEKEQELGQEKETITKIIKRGAHNDFTNTSTADIETKSFDIFSEMNFILDEQTNQSKKKEENKKEVMKHKMEDSRKNDIKEIVCTQKEKIKDNERKNEKEEEEKEAKKKTQREIKKEEEQVKILQNKFNMVKKGFNKTHIWYSHIELVDFVKRNFKGNDFMYIKRLPNNYYEQTDIKQSKDFLQEKSSKVKTFSLRQQMKKAEVDGGDAEEKDFMTISLNGVLINEKNETTFFELDEWRKYISLLLSAYNLKFIKNFKLYKYYFLLRNVTKCKKFKKRKNSIKENLLFLNEQFFNGYIQIQYILCEISDNMLLDFNITNANLGKFKEVQDEHILKIEMLVQNKRKHITSIITASCETALKTYLTKNDIVETKSEEEEEKEKEKEIGNIEKREDRKEEILKRGKKKFQKKTVKSYLIRNTKHTMNRQNITKKKSDRDINIYYNKIALCNSFSSYIKKYIITCQYMYDNTLRDIVIYTYEYFLNIINIYFETNSQQIDDEEETEEKETRYGNSYEVTKKKNRKTTGTNEQRTTYKLIEHTKKKETGNAYMSLNMIEKRKDMDRGHIIQGGSVSGTKTKSQKSEITLFSIALTLENDKLKINPELDVLLNTIMNYIYVSIDIISKREEFFDTYRIKEFFLTHIYTGDILKSKNLNGDDETQYKDKEEKNFSFFINNDEKIAQLNFELQEKMKILYNSMVHLCKDYEDIITAHLKFESINLKDINIMDTKYISHLFESIKEHTNKIKKMEEEINIYLFKVNSTDLLNFLSNKINTRWNELILYLPSVNNETINQLTNTLDNALITIRKNPTTIDELVSHVVFTNSFQIELITIEEVLDSITSLFDLFKKYYINIAGNQTTKLFYINQKLNNIKTFLHNERNYDLQYAQLFTVLFTKIDAVEKKILNFVAILKTHIFENIKEYTLQEIKDEIKKVTPIKNIKEQYYKELINEKISAIERKNEMEMGMEMEMEMEIKMEMKLKIKKEAEVDKEIKGEEKTETVTETMTETMTETKTEENEEEPFDINKEGKIIIGEKKKLQKPFYIFELFEFLRLKILDIKKEVDTYIYYQNVLKKKKK